MSDKKDIEFTLSFCREHDLNILPLRYGDKKPAVKEWGRLQKEKISGEEIKKYFKGDKKHNIAIIGGSISSNLVMLDLDTKEIYRSFFPQYKKLEKETTVVKTSHGYHIYFFTPTPLTSFVIPLIKNGETKFQIHIQGEGKYCVAPPSKHPSGVYYEWVSSDKIVEVGANFREEIISGAKRVAKELGYEIELPKEKDGEVPLVPIKLDEDLEAIRSKLTITQVAAKYGMLDLQPGRNGECKLHQSIGKKSFSVTPDDQLYYCHGCARGGTIFDLIMHADKVEFKEALAKAAKWCGVKLKKRKRKGKYSIGPLANEIMEEFTFKSLEDTEEMFVYGGGVYRLGKAVLQGIIQRRLEDIEIEPTRQRENDLLHYIQVATYTNRELFDEGIDVINLKNGLLNVVTSEVLPHTPEYLSFVQLPLVYDPNAECPKIKKFLGEILHEDDVPIIQELMGYCLYKNYPIQKAFMFLGDGSNGKSTLLSLIKAFLGAENSASIALQELCNNKFAIASLHGKLVNVFGDLPSWALSSTGPFKMLVGGDSLYAEQKFKHPFYFVNYSKQVFSCNRLPSSKNDDSDAFFRRWQILNFPNRFERENRDERLLEKLTTPEELSGLLNWALVGLRSLLDNGCFSNDKTTDEIREEYQRKSDPVASFSKDCLMLEDGGIVSKDQMYGAYIMFCDASKLPKLAKNVLGRELPKHIPHIKTVRMPKQADGLRPMAWSGVEFLEGVRESLYDGKVPVRDDDGMTIGNLDSYGDDLESVRDASDSVRDGNGTLTGVKRGTKKKEKGDFVKVFSESKTDKRKKKRPNGIRRDKKEVEKEVEKLIYSLKLESIPDSLTDEEKKILDNEGIKTSFEKTKKEIKKILKEGKEEALKNINKIEIEERPKIPETSQEELHKTIQNLFKEAKRDGDDTLSISLILKKTSVEEGRVLEILKIMIQNGEIYTLPGMMYRVV